MKRLFYLIVLIIICGITAQANIWSVNLLRSSWPKFVTANTPFAVEFKITNNGTEPISSLDVSYNPYGGTPMSVNYKFDKALPVNETDTISIDGFVCDVIAKEIFGTFKIDKVNGDANYGSDAYIYVMCGSQYIKRNLVIEEATGVTCGWCPIGVSAMEYMRETYTDGSWIGISVFNDSELIMTGTVYRKWYNRVGSTPNAIANRDFSSNYKPSKATFDELYQRYSDAAAIVGIRAAVDVDAENKKAKLDVQTYYALSEDETDYSISYVITEDNLGPYLQYNYYQGVSYECDGWNSKAGYVSCIYNDVARAGSVYLGIEESRLTSVSSDQDYDFSCTVDLSAVKNLNNAYITVMVMNKDGQVENAVRRKVDGSQNDKFASAETTDVTSLETARPNSVSGIYDMHGRKVVSPKSGNIYIERRSDGTTRKFRH